jgi:tyrosine-protein phosphatase YwqE
LAQCIKKERNSTNELLTRHTCYFKYIPGDNLIKLVEIMPRVGKAVIKARVATLKNLKYILICLTLLVVTT